MPGSEETSHPLFRILGVLGAILSLLAILFPQQFASTFNLSIPNFQILLGVIFLGFISWSVYEWRKWQRVKRTKVCVDESDSSMRPKNEEAKISIRQNSLTFYKYPFLHFIRAIGKCEQMTNMAYGDIYAVNDGKLDVKKCELSVILERKGQDPYDATVLSSEPDPDTKKNLLAVPLNSGREIAFHPLGMNLMTQQSFLPRVAFNAGNFSGTIVSDGEYDLYAKAYYDGKQTERVFLGKVKIPHALANSEYHTNIKTLIEKDDFVVSLEKYGSRIRAKFAGKVNDQDIQFIIMQFLINKPQIDSLIETNGNKELPNMW